MCFATYFGGSHGAFAGHQNKLNYMPEDVVSRGKLQPMVYCEKNKACFCFYRSGYFSIRGDVCFISFILPKKRFLFFFEPLTNYYVSLYTNTVIKRTNPRIRNFKTARRLKLMRY